jgi:uncharacterized repeat protein (TIGR01451 family)
MKRTHFIYTILSALLLSASALAAEDPSTASGRGPGNGEGGTPATGGGCSYMYSIQKIGPTYARHGENFTYHIFVKNLGNCRLRRIDLTDTLPHEVDLVRVEPAPSHSHHRRLVWENISLAAGDYLHAEIEVKTDRDHHGDHFLTNTACAYTPWIGTRICDSVGTTLYHRHGNHDHDDANVSGSASTGSSSSLQ